MALDTTVGGASSDSYLSVDDADAFFEAHWSTSKQDTWTALTAPQKESVLKAATQVIDSLRLLDIELSSGGKLPTALRLFDQYSITIHRQVANQRLVFPRNIDLDENEEAMIPQEVKDAQCEQAIYMVNFDESVIASQLQGVIEEAVTAGSVRFYQNLGSRGSAISPMAVQLLSKFIRPTRKLRRS